MSAALADQTVLVMSHSNQAPMRCRRLRMCKIDSVALLSQIALLYEAVTGQTPDLASTPAPALPPVASPQAAAGAGPAAGPGQPAAAPAAAPKPMLTSAASSPASGAGDNYPDDNISVTDLTGDESSALSQAAAPAVPNPAIRQPVGEHQAADLLYSLFYAASCPAEGFPCMPARLSSRLANAGACGRMTCGARALLIPMLKCGLH